MPIFHRILSLVVAFGIGLTVSWCSYQWITDPDRGQRRAIEEGIVLESRQLLRSYLAADTGIEISDALERVRAAGKVYIYPTAGGWELSGHYRRSGEAAWHPYLMALDRDGSLVSLAVQDDDPALRQKAAGDPKLTVSGRN